MIGKIKKINHKNSRAFIRFKSLSTVCYSLITLRINCIQELCVIVVFLLKNMVKCINHMKKLLLIDKKKFTM